VCAVVKSMMPAVIYLVFLVFLVAVSLAIDADPAHFAAGVAVLIVIVAAIEGLNGAKAKPPILRALALCEGAGIGLLIRLGVAAFIVVSGLLGVGSDCAPHRPYAC